MAHAGRRRRLESRESIIDLVRELELLGVSANGYRTADEIQKVRDERIKELKQENGVLDAVCFPMFLFLQ